MTLGIFQNKRTIRPSTKAVLVSFVFGGILLTVLHFGFVVYAQEQGTGTVSVSDDLGLDDESQETPGLTEAFTSETSSPDDNGLSPEFPPALTEGDNAQILEEAQDNEITGLPPQPEQSSDGTTLSDLPDLDVPVVPVESSGEPQPAKTDEGFDKMLERKGKAESPTPDSVKKKIAEDDRSPFKPEKIRSLFFTSWQHDAIVDAKKSRGLARPPTESELRTLDKEPPKPGERDLTLDGIVFVSTEDWTIWLNGMRVTPSAIPKEVIDLRVFKEYIEVKWLDEYTNQVFPIRLRAHQRFNLDMRIFLPG